MPGVMLDPGQGGGLQNQTPTPAGQMTFMVVPSAGGTSSVQERTDGWYDNGFVTRVLRMKFSDDFWYPVPSPLYNSFVIAELTDSKGGPYFDANNWYDTSYNAGLNYTWTIESGSHLVKIAPGPGNLTTAYTARGAFRMGLQALGYSVSQSDYAIIKCLTSAGNWCSGKVLVRAPANVTPSSVMHSANTARGYTSIVNWSISDQFGSKLKRTVLLAAGLSDKTTVSANDWTGFARNTSGEDPVITKSLALVNPASFQTSTKCINQSTPASIPPSGPPLTKVIYNYLYFSLVDPNTGAFLTPECIEGLKFYGYTDHWWYDPSASNGTPPRRDLPAGSFTGTGSFTGSGKISSPVTYRMLGD